MRFPIGVALLASVTLSAMPARSQGLKLTVSVQEQNIEAPNPVRAMLQFHNSGPYAIWLYWPIGSASQIASSNPLEWAASEPGPNRTSGESTLEVHLALVNPPSGKNGELAAHGAVLLDAGFPHPRLIHLAPGSDYDERVAIHVEPGRVKTGDGNRFGWGRYQFYVTYSAQYSNQDDLANHLGIHLWHGQSRSNDITLDMQPPTAQGSIEGTVVDSTRRPVGNILATLSDEDENALNQLRTDVQGNFSFAHLAWGRYWITVREPGATEDATVFRHVDISAAASHATPQIMMLPVEVSESKQLLHKPVLFRIVDASGRALAGVKIAIVWSNGTSVEDAKTATNEEGLAQMSLIPGRNFVTLQRHGCGREDGRADVAPGTGVDGFKFVYECPRK
jgi:Carboxypeptidase regulatory-like domain